MSDMQPKHERSFFFPLLLIALGAVLFLININAVQGSVWDVVVKLWPLLLIVGGLDGLIRRDGWVGPILLIGLGVIFQLSNFGLLAFNIWDALLRLWPILLIAIGLDIIFGRRSTAATIIVRVLLGVLLVAAVIWMAASPINGQTMLDKPVAQALDGATRGNLNIAAAVGSLHYTSGAAAGQLMEGNIRYSSGQNLSVTANGSGGARNVSLSASGAAAYTPGPRSDAWTLRLTDAVPLEISSDLAVGEQVIDLSGLQVERLKANVAVGRIDVTLPDAPAGGARASWEVSGAIGEIVVRVPRGAAVRVQSDTGLVSVSAGQGLTRSDKVITSPGYSEGKAAIDIRVNLAIGSVRVILVD